jgi:hypothetical protein
MTRFPQFGLALILAASLGGPLVAQEGGGGLGGGALMRPGASSGLPTDINAPRTIPQQFSSKLKLDKTQGPAAEEILSAAATEAGPFAQQMVQSRQRLLNASLNKNADETRAAETAYALAAAKIAVIEAAAFGKVYALLKPNQQKDAPQAFALLAGLFSTPTAVGQARGGARGTGGAR